MAYLSMSEDTYRLAKQAFQGGFTHANQYKLYKVLTGVGSHDLTSAYPAECVLEKFPMSQPEEMGGGVDHDSLVDWTDRYCLIIDVTYYGLEPKFWYDNPISASKCFELQDATTNNGRIMFAKRARLIITEQDYLMYDKYYYYSKLTINRVQKYEKSYLPKPLVESILGFYKDKTALKGVAGKEVDYLLSKGNINASYGMMVTDPIRIHYEYINDEHVETDVKLADELEKYNRNINRFLYYLWGVWVTAYTRREILSTILVLDKDYCYSDTDSVKYGHPEKYQSYFDGYNRTVDIKIAASARHFGLDQGLYAPCDPKGVSHPIGYFDYEGQYTHFKTLGAKRYLTVKDGVLAATVAGCSKKGLPQYLYGLPFDPKRKKVVVEEGARLDEAFELFDENLIVPPDYSGRLVMTYVDDTMDGYAEDYLGVRHHYKELSGIHSKASEYTLSMESFYNFVRGGEDWSE